MICVAYVCPSVKLRQKIFTTVGISMKYKVKMSLWLHMLKKKSFAQEASYICLISDEQILLVGSLSIYFRRMVRIISSSRCNPFEL